MQEKSLIYLQQNLAKLVNNLILVTSASSFQSTIVLILAGSILIPLSLIINPKYLTLVLKNSHLDSFEYSQCSRRAYSTALMCLLCSSLVQLQIRISSRYTQTKMLIQGCRISFINRCYVAGTLVRLNGIASNLNSPNFIQKAVRYLSPFLIQMLLKAATILILEKYLIPLRLFRVSLVNSNRY